LFVQDGTVSELDLSLLKRVAVECPGFQARATARALTRFYNGCFKPLGLTAEQFSLLVGIGAAHGASVVDLATSAGVDATTLSRGVQALQRRGLVQAEGGRGRAGKRLSLTLSGLSLMTDALPVWERAKASLSHRLSKATLRATRQAMMDLADAAAEADPASH
jgi:DNA-binding MarR family transcriptional regulator